MSSRYSDDELSWLREHYHAGTINDTLDAFERQFGRRPKRAGLQTKASKMGLRKDSTMRHTAWPPGKVSWFRSFVPGHTESEISSEHESLYGTPLTEAQIGNAKTRFGVRSGTHGGRFKKGMEPFNKGKKWADYGTPEGHERSRATCFKRGEINGAALKCQQPIGSERVGKDGYVEVKVGEGLQKKPNKNFRMKHHVVYEQAYGSIPRNCNIVFADRDKLNFDPQNLVAVPRELWSIISRQRWAYYDRESLEACITLAKLSRKTYEAKCHPRYCKACGAEFRPRYPHQRTCDACLKNR